MRKIRYKKPTSHLESKVQPSSTHGRASVGMEDQIGEYYFVGIEKLIPYQKQARVIFDQGELEALSSSIKMHGIRQPLTIKKSLTSTGGYEIVSGERRFRAAKKAGLKKLPCIMLKANESAEEVALIENLHREDLHPIEFGESCLDLLSTGTMNTQLELAEKLSIAKAKISECITFASLSEEIKGLLLKHNIKTRDKLRAVVQSNQDLEEVKRIIGIIPSKRVNFSVLRVTSTSKGLACQIGGISRLSQEERRTLRETLLSVVEDIKIPE